MNKSDLIESVQGSLDCSRKEAEDAVKAVLESLEKGIKSGSPVQLVGFGSFKISERAARMGRNPKTGEPMQIKASKSVRFGPSSALKKSL